MIELRQAQGFDAAFKRRVAHHERKEPARSFTRNLKGRELGRSLINHAIAVL